MKNGRITAKDVMDQFVDSDHYVIGLDKGRTLEKIMKGAGIHDPYEDTLLAYRRRLIANSAIQGAKRLFAKEGFTLDSYRAKNKPTVYFLVTPGSDERARYHGKLVKRASCSTERVRQSRLVIIDEMGKLKLSAQNRKSLTEAVAKRV